MILEQFHDDTLLHVPFLSLCSNLHIHVDLYVVHVESRHLTIHLRFMITVLAVLKDLNGGISLLLISRVDSFLHGLPEKIPVLFDSLVFGLKLHCQTTVVESLREILELHVSDAAEVECFWC